MISIEPYGIYVEHRCDPTGRSMPAMHVHPFHELYVLLSGRRRYFVEHTIYDVEPGDLVLIPKTCLHRTTGSGRAGYERYVLNFSEENHGGFITLVGREAFDGLLHSGCLQLPSAAAKQVQRDMEQILRLSSQPPEQAKALLTHLVQDVLLIALCQGKRKQPFHGESADKVQAVARYISEHYDRELTLREAAGMAYMEATWFSKRFKALTGFGFHEYLTRTRLLAAETLLRETDLSIGEIAERCGFSSSNYFGDVFRRWKGVSPTAWREQTRE